MDMIRVVTLICFLLSILIHMENANGRRTETNEETYGQYWERVSRSFSNQRSSCFSKFSRTKSSVSINDQRYTEMAVAFKLMLTIVGFYGPATVENLKPVLIAHKFDKRDFISLADKEDRKRWDLVLKLLWMKEFQQEYNPFDHVRVHEHDMQSTPQEENKIKEKFIEEKPIGEKPYTVRGACSMQCYLSKSEYEGIYNNIDAQLGNIEENEKRRKLVDSNGKLRRHIRLDQILSDVQNILGKLFPKSLPECKFSDPILSNLIGIIKEVIERCASRGTEQEIDRNTLKYFNCALELEGGTVMRRFKSIWMPRDVAIDD
ncbi:uncharacterized protein LOC111055537 isoform X2 [Nilaparvata lugens]|uniref:uncharacterized protein LOC111055537 isoform X2 n=1 Tax=Nilaparvata lugens TaxID=108931 RepID=UPI00193E2E3B|nr:uncharacterized protein LOC111055537 isoform X2 [Nilaparvata lugens]